MQKLQVPNQSGRTQLDTYLNEPTLDFDFFGAHGCGAGHENQSALFMRGGPT